MTKFPIQAGVYGSNPYYIFSSLSPVKFKNPVIQHKCDGCNGETREKEWLGKGNDYRVLHERRRNYCGANYKSYKRFNAIIIMK